MALSSKQANTQHQHEVLSNGCRSTALLNVSEILAKKLRNLLLEQLLR